MKQIRNTRQRSIVLDVVKKLQGQHPTAQTIYDEVSKVHPTISRGTVYRNLGILCEQNQIKKIDIESEADRYDAVCKPHAHFVCCHCQKVYDVPFEKIQLPDEMRQAGFQVDEQALLFKGLCPNCQEK